MPPPSIHFEEETQTTSNSRPLAERKAKAVAEKSTATVSSGRQQYDVYEAVDLLQQHGDDDFNEEGNDDEEEGWEKEVTYDQEIDGETLAPTSDFASEFEYLSTTKSSRCPQWQADATKVLFENAWKARSLSLDMEAQDLALGVAKMKIDLYEYDINSAIGNLASNHVKRYKSAKYCSEFRFWTRKYTGAYRKIENTLKEKERNCNELITLGERKKMLESKLNKSQIRTYDDWKRRERYKMHYNEADAMTRAKLAGDKILSIARQALNEPYLEMKNLTIAEIEYYSRGLDKKRTNEGEGEDAVSRESIKKYLKQYLGKDDKEINEFSRLRLDCRVNKYKEKRKLERQQNTR